MTRYLDHEVAPVASSLVKRERDRIDALSELLTRSDHLVSYRYPPSRAGTVRAMLRFVLVHQQEFLKWMEQDHD